MHSHTTFVLFYWSGYRIEEIEIRIENEFSFKVQCSLEQDKSQTYKIEFIKEINTLLALFTMY